MFGFCIKQTYFLNQLKTSIFGLKNRRLYSVSVNNNNVAQYPFKNLDFQNTNCCQTCHQLFTKFPLSQQSKHGNMCEGCTRLFAPSNYSSMMKNMIESIIIQKNIEIVPNDYPFNLIRNLNHPLFEDKSRRELWTLEQNYSRKNIPLYNSIEYRSRWAKRRKHNIVTMSKRKGKKGLTYPTKDEIMQLMERSEGKCSISGICGLWTMSGVPKCLDPFLLTIDHKNPLFKGGNSGIKNLQITLYCLNQVKGTESNHEMLRWFNIIRSITRP